MSKFDHTFTLTVGKDMVEAANHLVNCFESCAPGHTILQLEEGKEFATFSRPCTKEQYDRWTKVFTDFQAAVDKQKIIAQVIPKWNMVNESGQSYIDSTKLTAALTARDSYTEKLSSAKIYVGKLESIATTKLEIEDTIRIAK